MRIILADDEPVSRELLARTLRSRTDFDVEVVEDGSQALALAISDPVPDLLLLDWMMPGLTGPEVCRRVRAAELPVQPYVVLITVKNKREEVLEGLSAGADDFLSKPVAPDLLLARLALARKRPDPEQISTQAVTDALFAARDEGDGELVVRDREVSARVFFHGGRVAWAHLSDEKNTLLDLVVPDPTLAADTIREVVAECRRSGAKLTDTLVAFGLVDRAGLRDCLQQWLRRKLDSILQFRRPEVLFVPQKRAYSEELLFELEELVEDRVGQRPIRTLPPSALGVKKTWAEAFAPAEPVSDEVCRLLDRCLEGEGVVGAAVLDRATGCCLGQVGEDLSADIAWAHIQSLNVVARQEKVEDVIVVTDKHYHLVRFLPSSSECFVYLVADVNVSRLALARFQLSRAISGDDSGPAKLAESVL
jgi:DNA-binding response OmpR family regulator